MARIAFLAHLLAVAACSSPEDSAFEPASEEATMIVEADRGVGNDASPLEDTAEDGGETTMPAAMRGRWREDDLGHAPTNEDCEQTSTTNDNFGKVLTVRAEGYTLFETGGRIIEVHNRTDTMIDATFDTTPPPAPERITSRKDFALQQDGTLAINHDDADGIMSVTQYRPCPA
jgi:hemin uptake protein HemP